MAITNQGSLSAGIATANSSWNSGKWSPLDFQPGDRYTIGIGMASSGTTVSTVTDSMGNTYTLAVKAVTPKPAAGSELWYSSPLVSSASSNSFNVVLSASDSGGFTAGWFRGISTGNPLDKTASSAITTTSSNHSASAVTPTSSGALFVVSARVDASTYSTFVAGAGYTVLAIRTRAFDQFLIQGTVAANAGPFTTSSKVRHAETLAVFADTSVTAAAGQAWQLSMLGVQ